MIELAIRKSGGAVNRLSFWLAVSAIAALGLVWLSVALTGALALVVPPPLAPAITGAVIIGLAGLAGFIKLRATRETKAVAPPVDTRSSEELIARATRVAEQMAPGSPLMALSFAVLAGWASVSVPVALNPLLNKLLADVEKAPENRVNN